eukprot:scaffold114195_cov31-Prasinocladus_malaysianus.AAC.1
MNAARPNNTQKNTYYHGMVVHLYSWWPSSWRLAAASSRWASSEALIGTVSLHKGHSGGWLSCWHQTNPLIRQLLKMMYGFARISPPAVSRPGSPQSGTAALPAASPQGAMVLQ